MGFLEAVAKISVFVINFCFLLIGLTLLIVGILFHTNCRKFIEAIPSAYQDVFGHVAILSITIGSVIFFIAFLGCYGALKDNTCMLTSFGAIVFIIFLLQLGLGIYALVSINDTDDLRDQLNKVLETLFGKYKDGSKQIVELVDVMQRTLKCCGTTGRASWDPTPVPISCPDDLNAPGCQPAFYDFIMNYTKLIGVGALAVSIVEVCGAVLALCLSNCIKGRERPGAQY